MGSRTRRSRSMTKGWLRGGCSVANSIAAALWRTNLFIC